MRAMIRNQKQSPMILALQQRQHIDLFDRRTPSSADFVASITQRQDAAVTHATSNRGLALHEPHILHPYHNDIAIGDSSTRTLSGIDASRFLLAELPQQERIAAEQQHQAYNRMLAFASPSRSAAMPGRQERFMAGGNEISVLGQQYTNDRLHPASSALVTLSPANLPAASFITHATSCNDDLTSVINNREDIFTFLPAYSFSTGDQQEQD
jgi:hypothetical protein